MPPKRRTGGKGPPKKLPEVVLSAEEMTQLKSEVDWTISKLRVNISTSKSEDQIKKLNTIINTLG